MNLNKSKRYVLKGEELRQQRTDFVFVSVTYVLTWHMLEAVLLSQIIHTASLSAVAERPFRGTPARLFCGDGMRDAVTGRAGPTQLLGSYSASASRRDSPRSS